MRESKIIIVFSLVLQAFFFELIEFVELDGFLTFAGFQRLGLDLVVLVGLHVDDFDNCFIFVGSEFVEFETKYFELVFEAVIARFYLGLFDYFLFFYGCILVFFAEGGHVDFDDDDALVLRVGSEFIDEFMGCDYIFLFEVLLFRGSIGAVGGIHFFWSETFEGADGSIGFLLHRDDFPIESSPEHGDAIDVIGDVQGFPYICHFDEHITIFG